MKTLPLLLIIILVSSCSEQKTPPETKTLVTSVKTQQIKPTNVIRHHQIPALIRAKNRAKLSFQLSGTLDKLSIKLGDMVEKDEVLMGLYNPNLDPAIATNMANLESIKAQIIQVKRDVLRLKELRKNNSTSRNAFEQKETELKNLQARKKAIQAQIELAQANQKESFIKAPFDGTIVGFTKEIGEFVQAGENVISINQEGILELQVMITNDIWKTLALGDEITGKYEKNNLTFKITELSSIADTFTHLMTVVLETQSTLKGVIGQEVLLSFPERYKNVYQLPLETVVDDGINNPYVFMNNNGKAEKIHISPLYSENGQIIFKSKQLLSLPVIIKGQSKLSIGMRLKQTP